MSEEVQRARELRRDSSRAEKSCWELLRAHRMSGIKFRRQHQIGPYFADFACVSRKLVVEIDGEHHADQIEADAGEPLQWSGLDGAWCALARLKLYKTRKVFGQQSESRWATLFNPLSPPLPLAGERSMRKA